MYSEGSKKAGFWRDSVASVRLNGVLLSAVNAVEANDAVDDY